MSRVTLAKAKVSAARAVIFTDHSGPTFFGGGDTTFVCPHCGGTIANLVAADQIWDLVVECGKCRGACEFPRLPEGAKATGYVYVPPGRYRITASLDMSKGALMIGHGAVTGGGVRYPN